MLLNGHAATGDAEHAQWIGDDQSPTGTHQPRPRTGRSPVRADSRSRAIVFRALRLTAALLPTGEDGVGAARTLANGPLPRAWDRRVGDLSADAWRLLERLLKAQDTDVVWSEATMRLAWRRLHEVCPDLVERLEAHTYRIPFGELRDPAGARLARLERWCIEADARLETREIRTQRRDIRGRDLQKLRGALRRDRREITRAEDFPQSPPSYAVSPDAAMAAAARDLERLGAPIQGQQGDKTTFLGGCIGGDYGIEPEAFRPLFMTWGAAAEPPWEPRQLERKFQSSLRNRKRPWGYKLAGAADSVSARPKSVTLTLCDVWRQAERLDSAEVCDVEAGLEWLERQGLDPEQLRERDLVRVLAPQAVLPSCVVDGVSWTAAGYRLLLPVFDLSGDLAGVRARPIREGGQEVMAAGTRAEGLAFADVVGRAMLARWAAPAEIWIGQGGPDFLTLAALLGQDEGRAILGVFPGSWTAEHGARIPDGARVIVATHATRSGDAHARRIAATLGGRCRILRLVLPHGATVSEAHRRQTLDLTALRSTTSTAASTAASTLCAWDQQVLVLLARWSLDWSGPAREFGRLLLLAAGERVTPAAVRGLERALVRMHQRRVLPARIRITVFGDDQAQGGLASFDAERDDHVLAEGLDGEHGLDARDAPGEQLAEGDRDGLAEDERDHVLAEGLDRVLDEHLLAEGLDRDDRDRVLDEHLLAEGFDGEHLDRAGLDARDRDERELAGFDARDAHDLEDEADPGRDRDERELAGFDARDLGTATTVSSPATSRTEQLLDRAAKVQAAIAAFERVASRRGPVCPKCHGLCSIMGNRGPERCPTCQGTGKGHLNT